MINPSHLGYYLGHMGHMWDAQDMYINVILKYICIETYHALLMHIFHQPIFAHMEFLDMLLWYY